MALALPSRDAVYNPFYALLSLESRALLLPQREIRSLEPALDIKTEEPPDQGVGWLSFEHRDWPVYGFDEGLNPLSLLPASQRCCALLSLEDSYWGLLCTTVATVASSDLHIHPLPASMLTPSSPLSGVAVYGDGVAVVSTASALAEIPKLPKSDTGGFE